MSPLHFAVWVEREEEDGGGSVTSRSLMRFLPATAAVPTFFVRSPCKCKFTACESKARGKQIGATYITTSSRQEAFTRKAALRPLCVSLAAAAAVGEDSE